MFSLPRWICTAGFKSFFVGSTLIVITVDRFLFYIVSKKTICRKRVTVRYHFEVVTLVAFSLCPSVFELK